MKKPKTVVTAHKKNFDTLSHAIMDGHAALMECTLTRDMPAGQKVAVICAANKCDDGEIEFVPFAMFFNGNPYEILESAIETDAKERA